METWLSVTRNFTVATILLLAAAAILFLLNLGNQYLWQDEAQTALLASTIFDHGVPLGHDGKNSFSQEAGAEFGPNKVYRWHTWLSFYLAAGSFAVLGRTTFAARLPFALFGLATVALAVLCGRRWWGSRRAGLLAGLMLAGCIPFLLLSRQCRYYSLTAFFSLLGLWAYGETLARRRYGLAIFVAAGTLLFHSHYIYAAALGAAVAVHVLLFHRDRFRAVALGLVLLGLINLPWMIWLSGISFGGTFGEAWLSPEKALILFRVFFDQVRSFVFPWPLLLVPLAAYFWQKWRGTKHETPKTGRKKGPAPAKSPVRLWPKGALGPWLCLLGLFGGFTLVALSVFAPWPFFRYLAPLVPILCLLAALAVEAGWRAHWLLGLAGLVVFFAFQPLGDFAYEITHDFDGPEEGIVKYLQAHARPTDVVAITYGDLPVKFYTGLRVVGGLTGEDLTSARTADWIIVRHSAISDKDLEVRNFLINNVAWKDYKKVTLPYCDTPFENRESPGDHLFRTVKEGPPVIIFQRKN